MQRLGLGQGGEESSRVHSCLSPWTLVLTQRQWSSDFELVLKEEPKLSEPRLSASPSSAGATGC